MFVCQTNYLPLFGWFMMTSNDHFIEAMRNEYQHIFNFPPTCLLIVILFKLNDACTKVEMILDIFIIKTKWYFAHKGIKSEFLQEPLQSNTVPNDSSKSYAEKTTWNACWKTTFLTYIYIYPHYCIHNRMVVYSFCSITYLFKNIKYEY